VGFACRCARFGGELPAEIGWVPGQTWGEEVRLPDGFAYDQAETNMKKSISEWAGLGVHKISGEPLGESTDQAAIFLPAGYRGPAFLVRNNFDVILKYNASTSYALAIGLLSDRMKGLPGILASWPVDELPLDHSSSTALQDGLTALGFDTGGSDGVLGAAVRVPPSVPTRKRGACRPTASPRRSFSLAFSTNARPCNNRPLPCARLRPSGGDLC
jgi:membrane-bound lytic murein transglycosylase B